MTRQPAGRHGVTGASPFWKEINMTKTLADDLRKELNKAAKETIAYDLNGENPTDVKTWISTGSTLLDYIISNRRDGGIPVGKLTTIAGESASGKSLVATQILANTQKMGGVAVYIDTENAASPDFMAQLGLDTENNFMYIQPGTIEEVFESIERLIGLVREKAPDRLVCIVWDSVAGTPVKAEIEGDYDPNSRIGLTAKALAKGMRKVTETLGKTMKSRFGPSPRSCQFDVLFDLANDRVGVDDEGSWLTAIAGTPDCIRSGAWYTINVDGEDKKFQSKDFLKLLEDPKFKEKVLDILEDECRIGKK